jgi:hypothetical protein
MPMKREAAIQGEVFAHLRTRASPKVRFVLTLEGEAGADSAHARALRHVLKRLLRSHSLRCIEARQVDYRHDDVHRPHDDDGGKR